MSNPATIEGISAVTLATHDMARAVRFYRTLGFEVVHGDNTGFTSFRAGHPDVFAERRASLPWPASQPRRLRLGPVIFAVNGDQRGAKIIDA
jgi:catechol 2,3-dioxygenase-like lactoylglutathione lyase family enzyme